jgi:hypothetical protein
VNRPPRQQQRRLRPDDLEQLTAEYVAGTEVKLLAEQFRITRRTVIGLMRRNNVPGRYPRLGPPEVDEARCLYLAGKSLATIGGHLGVSPDTVRKALVGIGVTMRGPHDHHRTS